MKSATNISGMVQSGAQDGAGLAIAPGAVSFDWLQGATGMAKLFGQINNIDVGQTHRICNLS
jgi:hypothetical protein